MALGGKRKGAGNKKDSIRPNFNAFWSLGEIRGYMVWLKKNYKKDPALAKYVGDHLFGKPIQPLTGEGGGRIQISEVVVKVQK